MLLVLVTSSLVTFAQTATQNRPSNTTSKADPPVIDINKATVEDFDRLPGIGPVLAHEIVDYRLKHGPFHRVEDLLAIPRIGYKRWKEMRPHLKVGDDKRQGESRNGMTGAEPQKP